ncbi:MAG: hypothetical protein RSB50_06395 [Cetobacterium sp.]
MGETQKDTGMGGYGLIIFLILLFFIFFWGNGRGAGAVEAAAINGGCGRVSNCEVEKQGIIDSARTQYLIEQKAAGTDMLIQADGNLTRTKIDYYAFEALKDQLAQERTKNVVLENRVYSDAKFNAIDAQLASIECNMAKKPPVYAQVGIPCASEWPLGCGTSTTTKGLV